MIKVHTAPTAIEIHNLKNVLEEQGIECQVRGEFRKLAAGELPLNECWVELWILDDAQEQNALRLIARPSGASSPTWVCAVCRESMEGQFDQCWNCQADRPAPAGA